MAKYDFGRLSILIVEDSQFMVGLMTGILRALGIERIIIGQRSTFFCKKCQTQTK